jgi:flagellar hook-associated protein 3 FlgL
MRISTNQIQQISVNAQRKKQAEIQVSQSRLSSGLRIEKPSDDPAGIGQVIKIQQRMGQLSQYDRNANTATSTLNLQDRILSSVNESLQKLREIALQGSTPADDGQGRSLLAQEVLAQTNILLSLANTKEAGEFIFAGSRIDSPPFANEQGQVVYQGFESARTLPINDYINVVVRDPGSQIFSGPNNDLFATAEKLHKILLSGNLNPVEEMGEILAEIDQSMATINTQRAIVGARLSQIENITDINKDLMFQLQSTLSNTRDTDFVETISQFNQQIIALEAAQKVFLRVSDLSLFRLFN